MVDSVLKGAEFDRKLVTRTPDGLAIQPLSPRRADAAPVAGARGTSPWGLVATLDHPDPQEANRLALGELEGGADQIMLAFAGSHAARGFGLPDARDATLNAALAGIHAEFVTIRLEPAPFAGMMTAERCVEHWRSKRLTASALTVDFGIKPLADWARIGRLPSSWVSLATRLREGITALRAAGFAGPFLRADSRPFHEAGASDAQEIAILIAQGVAYLRLLQKAGLSPQQAQSQISFTVTVDQDQFGSIAKLRALRRLWAAVITACGAEPEPARLHAETAFRMMTRRDPHVNILRNTIAGLAAGLGGADSLTILPHSLALGLPDEAARRLARNTGLILLREANLARVIDPSEGAGSIEDMTDGLADTAWAFFQQIDSERQGALFAMPAAMETGLIARAVATTRDTRLNAIRTRRIPVTGVSEFPDLAEMDAPVLKPAPPTDPQTGPFPAIRLAEPFEALRDRADILAAAGQPPRLFLACLGRLADFTPRATFARNAYEAGGIVALGQNGFPRAEGGTDLEALVAAFAASGASAACLVGTDADYAPEALPIAKALAAAGAAPLFLAGRPGDLEPALREAGVTDFLFAGMDLVQHLDSTLTALAPSNGPGEG